MLTNEPGRSDGNKPMADDTSGRRTGRKLHHFHFFKLVTIIITTIIIIAHMMAGMQCVKYCMCYLVFNIYIYMEHRYCMCVTVQ